MAESTRIEWCDMTFNPVRGCTKVSAGCANCYADRTRVVASEAQWKLPVKWNREAAWCGNEFCKASAMGRTGGRCSCGLVVGRPRVFCASLADVFEDWTGPMVDSKGERLYWPNNSWREPRLWVPDSDCGGEEKPVTMTDVRRRLFDLIYATPNLDWLLLTKRPENIAKMTPTCKQCETVGRTIPNCSHCGGTGHCFTKRNVWLGTSVENQAAADARIPHLLRTPAAVRFLSCEPLLGPVDVSQYLRCESCLSPETCWCADARVNWVIAGGESGPGARPMHPDWARSLRNQCHAAGVAFFFKQFGEFQPYTDESRFTHGDTETDRNSHVWMHRDGTSGLCWISDEDCHWQNWTGEPQFDPETGMLTDEYAVLAKVGKKAAGRLLDGREWSEFPEAKGTVPA